MTKTWNDYLEECLSEARTPSIRIGVRRAFDKIEAEFPAAEVCRAAPDLLKAVEANVSWFEAEDKHLGTFHDRMDMCSYAEWASRKAIGQDVGEFKGVPRLILTRSGRGEVISDDK